MRCTRAPSKLASATSVEATFVAFESLTNSTSPIRATSSRRCSTPANVRRPARTAAGSIPRASAIAAAAAALARLCAPRRRISAWAMQRLAVPPQLAGAVVQRAAGAERHAPGAPAEVLDGQPDRRDRDVVVALAREDLQLRGEVVLERAVAVEVIGLDVEQDRPLGGELQRVLELKRARLADDDRRGREAAGQRAERRADVAGDRHRHVRRAVDVAEQLDGRRLAVRPGHGDELVGQQAPAELELAEDRHGALPRRGDHRRLARHARRLDDRPRVRQAGQPVRPEVHVEARGQVRREHRAAVDGDHALAERQQRPRRRDARAREADDEPGAVGQRRSRPSGHHAAMEYWYSVKPIALQIAAMIQKRRMIFVSDQPSSSKWWWIGAIRKGRLRKV